MKICCKCKEPKPLSHYNRNASKRDGHATECKPCKLKANARRDRTPQGIEKRRIRNRRYYYDRGKAARQEARQA